MLFVAFLGLITGLEDPCKSNLVKQIKQGVIRQGEQTCGFERTFSPVDIKRIVQVYGSSLNLLDF